MLQLGSGCPTCLECLQKAHVSVEALAKVYILLLRSKMRIQDIKIERFALTERMWGNWKKFNRWLRDLFKRRGMHPCTPDNDCGCGEGFYHWTPLCENLKSHIQGLESSSSHTSSWCQLSANTSETGYLLMHICLASLEASFQDQ